MSGNSTNHCCSQPTNGDIFLPDETWKSSAAISAAVVIIAINVITLLGNAIVIVALAKIDVFRTMANNQVVISLAAADFLVGLLVMPCATDSILAGKWRCGRIWGKMNAFGNFCFCISSIIHLAVLSIDRYIAIMRPLVYRSMVTKRRARFACLFSWIYAIVWSLPPLFGITSYECFIPYIGKCLKEDWKENQLDLAFAVAVVCGTYGVAMMTMLFAYWKIFFAIWVQTRRVTFAREQPRKQNDSSTGASASTKKGVLTVLIVIGTYVACWSPFCCLLFVQMALGKNTGGSTAENITMFIGFANSACNPIIYCIRYRQFKKTVKRMFQRTNGCCKRILVSNSERYSNST